MKLQILALVGFFSFSISLAHGGLPPSLQVTIEDGGKNFLGDLYLPAKNSKKVPLVIVIHEWWGKNEYPGMRGKKIADELGYAALVVDLYGEGKVVNDPKSAGEMAGPFYKNPNMAVERLEKFIAAAPAIAKGAGFEIDTKKEAAIGYCFGGTQALALARTGKMSNVVVFHAGLGSSLKADGKSKLHLLVLHGNADQFVKPEEVKAFKEEMKKAHADMKFVAYDDATHAFTNANSTAVGKKFSIPIAYNEKADQESWAEMVKYFKTRF